MAATTTFFPLLDYGALYDFKDKRRNMRDIMDRFYARCSRIFRYVGLPDSIDRENMELYNQTGGFSLWMEHRGELYAFTGGLGGLPDAYYHPTIATIANPALNLDGNFKIGEDCILMKNDSLLIGLDPLIRKYATLIAECELSLSMGLVNTRLISILTAKDDNQKEALDMYISDIEDGNLHSVFDESFILDGIKVQPYAAGSYSNNVVQLTEIEQFLMGNLFRELGLRGAYNTKRENISEAESKVGDDTVKPLIDDMLACRQEACEKINERFGTNISVELDSAWEDVQEETQATEETEEPEGKEGAISKIVKKLTGGKSNEEEEAEAE